MTYTITLQLRASGDTPEAVLLRLRERLIEPGTQLEEIRIKPASKRGGDK